MSVFAADFKTGQAARLVIGQPTFTEQYYDSSEYMPSTPEKILGAAGGVAYGGGVLVIADSNRMNAFPAYPRVLIYRENLTQWPTATQEIPFVDGVRCPVCVGAADVILGRVDVDQDGKPHYVREGENNIPPSAKGFRLPIAVATDGTHLAVADTENNRVLIWNSIPTSPDQPADVVVGQPDFASSCPNATGPGVAGGNCPGDANTPNARSLRAPQGVWLHDGKLFVADEKNYRVLIWNRIPTENFAPADVVLGVPNFETFIEPDLTKGVTPTASNLLNPVSVTTDGQRLFVADLGHNRVLIWNSIPTENGKAADVVVGQPDMTSWISNNSTKLCEPIDQDAEGNSIYPLMCAATLNFPRFALSDGQRLFIADGGNDRVLVFNQIPQQNGAKADAVLGQLDETSNMTSDAEVVVGENIGIVRRSASDAMRTPTALAWDPVQQNLFVTDPYDRRVLVFSPAENFLPRSAIRNAASFGVYAIGYVEFGGNIKEGEEVGLEIGGIEYRYKIQGNDTIVEIIDELVAKVNAGDGNPYAIATPDYALSRILVTARVSGPEGNEISISGLTSTNASIEAVASGITLEGGYDAARIAGGALASIFGENLADLPDGVVVPAPDVDPLPRELAGVQVYVDGMQAPLLAVSRNQINIQVPFEVLDRTSSSAYVRTRYNDGSVSVTAPQAIPVVQANPGIFAYFDESEPRRGIALHASSHATGTVWLEGLPKAGDKVTITINGRQYSYTATEEDVHPTDTYVGRNAIADKLIQMINDNDPEVWAMKAGQFVRILLRARVEGPAGNGIVFDAESEGDVMAGVMGGQVVREGSETETAQFGLCCANVAGSLVTPENPAVPGENIIVYATGLGMIKPQEAAWEVMTGFTYKGTPDNIAVTRMDAMAGGYTANVLSMSMVPGSVGLYQVLLELSTNLPTNPATQLSVQQNIFVSNVVTIPVVNPRPPDDEEEEEEE
jgi:uncharacterized protein (TIGR03437 family)